MTDLERLGLALIGFAVAVVVAGVLLGLIAAWITKSRRGHG
jgi:predicted membrane protein